MVSATVNKGFLLSFFAGSRHSGVVTYPTFCL